MFVGHFAVGLASKRPAPRTSLVWLLCAPIFLDLLWPIFLLLGIESVRIDPGNTAFTPLDLHDYPWTHSLLMAVVWSLLYGAVVFFAGHRDERGAVICGLGVYSHWVLDFVTHRPDMPLYPGSATYVGLGLWNSVAGTMIVELSLWAAGIAIYLRATTAKGRAGWISIGSLVLLLTVLYFVNAFSPPPPDERSLAWGAMIGWITVPWAWWIERTRTAAVPVPAGAKAP